jgi:hypothetical protein
MKILPLLEAIEHIVTTAAIVIGGVWAYYRFIKDRVYRIRLEPSISGEIIRIDDRELLLVTLELKNAGVAKVNLKQEGSGFRVFTAAEIEYDDVNLVEWNRAGTFPVFEDHVWIESGEVIREDHLIAVPYAACSSFRLELRIVSEKQAFKSSAVAVSRSEAAPAQPNGKES